MSSPCGHRTYVPGDCASCDCNAAMIRAERDPDTAVRQLEASCAIKPNNPLLLAIANISVFEPRIYQAGAHKIFIKYALGQYPSERFHNEPHPVNPRMTISRRRWETPVLGLYNILAHIGASGSRDGDAVAREIRDSYSAISEVIARDLPQLLPPGFVANIRRDLVAGFMGSVFADPRYSGSMYDETSLSLAMHCWLYMSSEPPSNDTPPKHYNDPYQLLQVLLMDGARRAVTSKNAVKRATEVVEIDTIISCVGSRISDANTLGETLRSDLTLISLFIGVDEATTLAFAHARFYEMMAEGVCRHLSSGVTSETQHINKMARSIMDTMFAPPIARSMITESPRVLAMACLGLVTAERDNCAVWLLFFRSLSGMLDSDNRRASQPSPFTKACRTQMEHLYIRTATPLRALGPSGAARLKVIDALAAKLQLDGDASIYAKWKRNKECSSAYCDLRNVEQIGGMRKCQRCASVVYHGPACQKSDWKGHKLECRKD